MKLNAAIFFALVFLLATAGYASADVLDLYLSVPKAIYGPGERIELYGGLYNVTANSSGISGASIAIYIINNSGSTISSYTLNTTSGGIFYSRNSYNTNSTLVPAPNATGNYTVRATYDASGTAYNSSATIIVASRTVDEIRIRTDSPVYYPSSAMEIAVEAATLAGEYRLPVANITINGTVRDYDESILSTFNCITDSNGRCTISKTSPAGTGSYFVEANNYIGYTTFKVVPFEVDVYIKDDAGENLKNTFYPSQTGYVEVRASYNGSNPAGDFTVTGSIYDSNGTSVSSITSFALNSDNSYVNKAAFNVGAGASGTYTARVVVSKTGDGSVNGSASYQVKQWELSSSKTATNNGFESGYVAFGNATVYFKADVIDLANGTSITGLEGNFTVRLKNPLGDIVANATVTYNSTLDDYLFNMTLPSVVGTYTLYVGVAYSGQTQTVTRTITVAGTSATVTPADAGGKKKEVFTISEFVYLKVTAKNATSDANVTDAEIISLVYEDGTQITYNSTQNCNSLNLTDGNSEWCWNSSTSMIKMDPPKKGGLFTADIYANNRSISASGRFAIKPYIVCVATKASENVNEGADYYWQFKTTDKVYLLITLAYTQDTTGMTTGSSGNGSSGGGGMLGASYGMGSACTIGNTESAVENATINILKVVNIQSAKTEALNSTTSLCKSTTVGNKAAYICTLDANDSRWDGGRYSAVLDITGPDSETKDKGYGMFEARSFYLYGWPNSWQNKPASNITFNIYMYSGGSGGWFSGSGGGMSGTVTLEKIRYMGSGWGDWITPVDYDYNTQGMSAVTITNGIGNLTLNATRAPGGRWRSGMYSATIKGTDSSSGDVDYGEIWFEIRNWYAWAQMVDLSGGSYQYQWQANTRENVTLYVKISNAGDSWSSSGQSLGGNVTIRVKKIEYYTTWPPKELPAANYTATAITVNASNCDIWQASSCFGIDSSKYIINISPTSGRWTSGYHNIVLDINGSETGWGGFNAISFYVGTQPVDINGTYSYTSKGNGSVYANITATKSQKYYYSYYSTVDYINTTFESLTLHRWDSSGGNWRQVDLKYPQDIGASVVGRSDLNLTGISTLNITYNSSSGRWPTGYYYGELVLRNNQSDTATGWIWFSIEPFRVELQSSQYEVSQDDNVTAALRIYEPGWSASTPLSGNYTITQVVQRTWTYSGEQATRLNYTPQAFNGSNTTITIQPPGGSWSSGWKSLTVTVNDTASGATKEGWLSFRVVPFRISLTRVSDYTIGTSGNLTVLVNLTNPKTSTPAQGNLSKIYKWSWPSKTYYTFHVGDCNSAAFDACTINGSANVTITPPAGGWDEGYNYVQFAFTTTTNPAPIDDWSSVGFEARPLINGYMYAVDDSGNYLWAAANTSNITMYLYSLQDRNWNTLSVNVTAVQYWRSSGYWVEERSRTYSSIASWSVINITTGQPKGSNEITGSGYVKLNPPAGTWENGEYYLKMSVSRANGDSGTIRGGWFRIKDMTPLIITVNSPQNSSTINASYIIFNATTSKSATCSVSIMNSGGTYYYAYLSQYGGYGGSGSVTTGGAAHTFNHSTSSMPDQAYSATFYCNDYDYNYANALASFTLNVSGSGGGNQSNGTSVPVVQNVIISPSYPNASSTLRCNATVISNASSTYINVSWYKNGTETTEFAYTPQVANNTNTQVSTVPSANLSANDIWKCRVRATTNLVNYSGWIDSANVTVTGNVSGQSGGPWFTSYGQNSTLAGNNTLFFVYWHSSANLSGYIFSFDSGNGTLYNDSWTTLSGADSWSNITRTLNSTANATIQWKVYANNSGNLWNSTSLISFNTAI